MPPPAKLAVCVWSCLLVLVSVGPARSASVRDDVVFSTSGQALFGPDQGQAQATKTITFGDTPVFQDKRGPVTDGLIYHLDQGIPVETAQAIWQKAIDTCTTMLTRTQTVSVKIPIFGTVSRSCRGTVTPTQSECINGGTIRPTLSATCCIYGGTYPHCTNGLGPDTVTVTTNKLSFDVGSGIGPEPTTGSTRPYDIGLVATVRSDVEVGIEGQVVLDGGSVDVTYPASFRLQTSADNVAPGGTFEVTATQVPGAVRMSTRYPSISLGLDTYSKVNARIDLEYAGVNYDTGDQIHSNITVNAFNTANNPNADDQGRIVNPIVQVKAGLGAGLQVQVNTDVALGGDAGTTLDPIGPFMLPLQFTYDVTNPPMPTPFCDVFPRPDCSINPPISTDIVEMLFRTPLLDTPAAPDFNGGNDYTGVAGQDVPIQQARNELLPDGSVRNTTITGKRDALQSSLEAVGGDLKKLGISDGVLGTDLVRLGVDIDGSLTGFGLPPGGVNVELPPQLPEDFFIPQLRGKHLLEAEANLIDLDAVDFLYFDQEIVFRPNFKVELRFDKPVEVRVVGSGTGFEMAQPDGNGGYVTELPVSSDGTSALEVKQVEGGVSITPSYSISDNVFENNLDWLINSGIQGTVGELKLGGYIAAIAAPLITGTSGVDSLDFALGQFAPTFDNPLRIPAHDHFTLGGFGGPVAGSVLSVSANPVSPTRTVTAPPTVGATPGTTPPTAGISPTPGEGQPTATPIMPPPFTFTPTPTATATPTPTPPDHGDANCDNRLSAADVDALLPLLGTTDSGPCAMADANEDGVVDQKDLNLVLQLLFPER